MNKQITIKMTYCFCWYLKVFYLCVFTKIKDCTQAEVLKVKTMNYQTTIKITYCFHWYLKVFHMCMFTKIKDCNLFIFFLNILFYEILSLLWTSFYTSLMHRHHYSTRKGKEVGLQSLFSFTECYKIYR